jgi:hypothetical protein
MKNKLRHFTKEHRQKISDSRKALYASGAITTWSKGKKMSRDHILKNMKAHLKYDVSLNWLNGFKEIDKVKFLNRAISRKRDCEGFTTEIYKKYIKKFYKDKKFNDLYFNWVVSNNKWLRPSLDHIEAKANGGTLSLDNLQFVSWLENRAKADIRQDEWNKIKRHINLYL